MRRFVFPAVVLLAWLTPVAAHAQPAEPSAPAEQVVLSGDVLVPKGRVAGQVVVFSGSATVLGVVDGDVVVIDGPIVVQGQVSGDVVAVDGSVRLGENAQVTGSVLAGEEIAAEDGAQVGGVSRRHVRLTLGEALGPLGTLLPPITVAVSFLLVALLWLLVAPRGGDRVSQALATAPLASLGWGVAAAVALPVVGLVATVSVLGLPFGLALLLGLGLLWLVGLAAAAWGIGRLIVREPRSRAGAVLVGWAIVTVLGLVPYLNVAWWVLGAIAGLGSIVVAAWRVRRGGGVPAPTRRRTDRGGRHAAGRVTDASFELPATPLAED
jgi:hypothetical protein